MSSEYPEIVFSFENNRRKTQPALFEAKSQATSENLLKRKHLEIESLHWDKIIASPLNLKSPGRSPSRSPVYPKSPVFAKSPVLAKSPNPSCFRSSRPSKTYVVKAKARVEKQVKTIIHSKSDTLSIAEEVTGEEELLKIKETLGRTKRSLCDIRTDAGECFKFSKNLIVASKKRQKNLSLFTETQAVSQSFNMEAQRNILRQMSSSINLLNERVLTQEEKHEEFQSFEKSIKSQVTILLDKVEKKKRKKDKNKPFLSKCQLF